MHHRAARRGETTRFKAERVAELDAVDTDAGTIMVQPEGTAPVLDDEYELPSDGDDAFFNQWFDVEAEEIPMSQASTSPCRHSQRSAWVRRANGRVSSTIMGQFLSR